MVLADILQRVAPRWDLEIRAFHLNHLLRGAESEAQEAFVRSFCADRGIPLTAERVDVRRYAQSRGLSLEMAGRRLRYERLEKVARRVGTRKIATAHTLDDQLETVLLRLVMGTGLKGLTGIPERSGSIIRPLLCLWAHEVLTYAEARGLAFFEDSSNKDLSIPRNYIRAKVVPGLVTAMESRILKTFPNTMLKLADEYSVLADRESLFQVSPRTRSLARADLVHLPDAIARTVLRSFLRGQVKVWVSEKSLQSVISAVKRGNEGRRWNLTKDYELVLRKGVLRVKRSDNQTSK